MEHEQMMALLQLAGSVDHHLARIAEAEERRSSPFKLYRGRLRKMRNADRPTWCAHTQNDEVVVFGDSPAAAVAAFDKTLEGK